MPNTEQLIPFDLSLTVTSHLVTTIFAKDEAEARKLCEAHHSPDDVIIHAVQEVDPQNILFEEEIRWCCIEKEEKHCDIAKERVLGC